MSLREVASCVGLKLGLLWKKVGLQKIEKEKVGLQKIEKEKVGLKKIEKEKVGLEKIEKEKVGLEKIEKEKVDQTKNYILGLGENREWRGRA